MPKGISWQALAAVAAAVLSGGILALPAGLALMYVLAQREEERQKGELDDAKKY